MAANKDHQHSSGVAWTPENHERQTWLLQKMINKIIHVYMQHGYQQCLHFIVIIIFISLLSSNGLFPENISHNPLMTVLYQALCILLETAGCENYFFMLLKLHQGNLSPPTWATCPYLFVVFLWQHTSDDKLIRSVWSWDWMVIVINYFNKIICGTCLPSLILEGKANLCIA